MGYNDGEDVCVDLVTSVYSIHCTLYSSIEYLGMY
jgi:hypothetical protein